MALVANYDSSDCSEDEEDVEQPQLDKKLSSGGENDPAPVGDAPAPASSPPKDKNDDDDDDDDDNNDNEADGGGQLISDDEEDLFNGGESSSSAKNASWLGDDEAIPGLSSTRSFFDQLPSASSSTTVATTSTAKAEKGGDFIDREEDLSTIPQAKPTEKAAVPIKPKKRKGPVKIVLPSLADFGRDDDDEGDEQKPKRPRPSSSTKSTLLSLLPQPKNTLAVSASAVPKPKPLNARPQLVPHAVSRKKHAAAKAKSLPKAAAAAAESKSDDEEPTSFFTLDEPAAAPVSAAPLPQPVQARPLPSVAHPEPEEPLPGPSVGPALPAMADHAHLAQAYPEADDLMANTDALERLAGKNALRRGKQEEDTLQNVVEVKGDDLTAERREWMTKALTEDDPDRPGPRCDVKGQTKRKHQITYLAALAKENEHKLKQQWSQSAANKKAAGQRYGF